MTENAATEPKVRAAAAVAVWTKVALGGGIVLLGAGALLLWVSQGAGVFLESAFAAVIACF